MKRLSEGAPKLLERDIQRQIIDWLGWQGIFAFRTNTGAAMLPGRAGKPQLVRFGFKGVSDILGIVGQGQFLSIEVKRPGGKLTIDQEVFRELVVKNGGLYILAKSLDDVKRALEARLIKMERMEVSK